MKQRTLAVLTSVLSLLVAGGCASNNAGVAKDKAAMLSVKQTSPSSDVPPKPQKLTNAIVAIVNEDIITLHDVNREAQAAIIEEEKKKGTLNDAARNLARRTALDRLIEKKLTEQKIKELGIKVSEEEIRQAIDDVRKQNNITSQDALVAALAGQGLTFDQYRAQLQEQIEKLRLVSMEVRAKVHVSETEMRDYYATNLAKYTEDESYHARHIFFQNRREGYS